MATDSDRLSEGMQHILQLASLTLSPQGPADNRAQQSVAQKTIYTRTDLNSYGLPTNQNGTKPQAQFSAGQGDAKTTTVNRNPIQMETEIEPKPVNIKKMDLNSNGMQTEINVKAEQNSHDNNSIVPKSNPIIRPSILATENLSRKRKSLPDEPKKSGKRDLIDIFGIGAKRSRSTSPFQWYKNNLVRPLSCHSVKTETMLEVVLSPRQLHDIAESLSQASIDAEGNGGDDVQSTDLRELTVEEVYLSHAIIQELDHSLVSTVNVRLALDRLRQKQAELQMQLEELEYCNNRLLQNRAQERELRRKERAKKCINCCKNCSS